MKMFLIMASLFFSLLTFASEIKVGDIVYGNNGDHLVGKVNAILDNNEAELTWSLFDGEPFVLDRTYIWSVADLSKSMDCHKNICIGDTVTGINDNGSKLVGKVNRTFENGKVEILWDLIDGKTANFGRFYYWSSEHLTRVTTP